jgi:hypothetical protein
VGVIIRNPSLVRQMLEVFETDWNASGPEETKAEKKEEAREERKDEARKEEKKAEKKSDQKEGAKQNGKKDDFKGSRALVGAPG